MERETGFDTSRTISLFEATPVRRSDERLVLRPGWFLLTVWLLAGIPFTVLGIAGCASALADPSDPLGWVLIAAGLLFGVLPLLFVARCRLILMPDGFRVRRLWKGRLVPWSAVRGFYAADDVGAPGALTRGVRWLPRQPAEPAAGMVRLFWGYNRREVPTFGRSREDMLETLQTWLQRYS